MKTVSVDNISKMDTSFIPKPPAYLTSWFDLSCPLGFVMWSHNINCKEQESKYGIYSKKEQNLNINLFIKQNLSYTQCLVKVC